MMNMNTKNFFTRNLLLTAFLFSLGTLISCGNKKQEIQITPEVEVKPSNHTWYFFTGDSFEKIDKPQHAPFKPLTPWTEAVRISSAGTSADSESLVNNAYAVVNRVGILCFQNDKISIAKDANLFANRTAGNLVFLNNTPIFSVYKSAFFNDSVLDPDYKKDESQHLFLIHFEPTAKICYPIIHSTNLIDEPNSEVTDYTWDGFNWICSIKSITDIKNEFTYINWKPTIPLLELSPGTAKNFITVSEATQDEFRKSKEQLPYKNAPERIKAMLSNFAGNTPFQLEIKSAGGTSARTYINNVSSAKQELKAKAIISQSWSSVLFEDGTLFIEGALSEKHILREGKPVAIRLPKLPAGYIYSDFAISGTTLYVAWEESQFYTTGRSGFLQINLENTLYSKLL